MTASISYAFAAAVFAGIDAWYFTRLLEAVADHESTTRVSLYFTGNTALAVLFALASIIFAIAASHKERH